MLRDDCANEECGHAPESHFRETIPTGRREEPLVSARVACLMSRCDCPCYVPPDHLRHTSR